MKPIRDLSKLIKAELKNLFTRYLQQKWILMLLDVWQCTHINAGHPQVYIKLDTRTEGTPQTCKYCGLQYVKKGHGSHHH
ncbi:unnamed protein product (macronuclear) [Paramecium tetraurelia]|uniref:Zinc finger CHCC-type domain-containing protein n=1 Tax=Paramecium tetraurelia TaxID=5888 RepID=A0CYQ9_PARTE|nr:uncharacterized protein GSPATT00011527001 [Paramecium tetraurelia]CAK75926.1 unnamed protein product [Paramecium tetraurelia]|eukprot:XP_001443323.1 hypothetical protein (macronuclear) [Paramecium tetraurelia strain d4-2]